MAWEKVKLGDVCLSISDGDHLAPSKADAGIPFVTISNIDSTNHFDFSNTMFVPIEYYEKLDEKRKPQQNDILYSVVGSFGIPVFMSETKQFVFQRHIAILRPNEKKVYPKYLYYLMLSRDFYMKVDAVALGAAQRTVSLTSLRNISVDLPHVEEQRKIADILSAYDNLIENNQKQIKLLEEAAQRLYKQWFIDLKYPGHETTKIQNGLPEGWNIKSVNSVVDFLSGYAFKSGSFVDSGKYKIVTIKNVQDGSFDGDDVSTVDEIPSKMPNHCVLEDGDILLSLTGNVGRVCLVVGDDYLLNQRVAKLKSHYHAYTYCLFRSKDMFDEMNNLANGAAQQNLSPVRTGEIKITVPLESVLDGFESVGKPIIQQMMILNKQITSLKQARDRLLPKLMSGKLNL